MSDNPGARQRERRIALSAVTSALSKGTSMLVMLVSVPLGVEYLGAERYGLWMTLTSLLALFALSDLGVGASLVNAVARTHSEEQRAVLSRIVATGFSLLLAVAAVVLVLFFASYSFLNWSWLLNVTQPALQLEAAHAFAVLVICFAVGLPLTVIGQVQNGLLEGYRASAWSAVGAVFGLGGLWLAVRIQASLPLLVLVVACGPLLASLLNACYEFGLRRPWLRPRLALVSGEHRRQLLGQGLLFLALQLCHTVVASSDNFVAAHLLGLGDVAHYSVAQRMFVVPAMLLGFVFNPLWPAYQQAKARGDHAWIARTFRNSLWLALAIGGVYCALAVVFGPWLIARWVGPEFVVTFGQLLGFAAWCLCTCFGGAVAMLLNGLGVLGPQALLAVLNMLFSVLLKVILTQHLRLEGLAWGGAISMFSLGLLPGLWLSLRALRAMNAPARVEQVRLNGSGE